MSGQQARIQAENLTPFTRFDVDEYVTKLVEYMSPGPNDEHLDWHKLGRVAMGICRRPPTMDFMLGPLSVEKRVVHRKETEHHDAVEIVRPHQVLSSLLQFQYLCFGNVLMK